MTANDPKRTGVRFPLRIKLWLFAGVLSVAHLLGVGWAALALTRASIETSQRELQVAIIANVATKVGQQFRAAQDALDLLGRTLTDDTLTEDARISLASTLVASNESLDNAVVFDANGALITPIVEDAAERLETPTTLQAALRETADREGLAAAEVSSTALGPRVLIVVPMRADDQVTGYAASLTSLAPIQDAVEAQADAHFTDPRSAMYIVDAGRRYVAHSDPESAASLASADHEPALADLEIASIVGRMAGAAEFESAAGDAMVGTVVGLPTRGWAVVAQIPDEVAYAPVYALRRVIGLAVAVAIAIALVSSLLLARHLTSPLNKLSDFARAIARREYDTQVTVQTSDELALLGDVMVRAAADLQTTEQQLLAEEAIRTDLRRYLPGELVDKVVRREQSMDLGGERRSITVLFADVVAFTPLTQQRAPEEVVEILNELFTIVTEIVFRHGGTVDKFIGDCVMAVWGAPTEMEDHAAAALEAAEEITSWLEAGNARWKERYGATVELAIGINSGPAVVGNIGSDSRMEYTAIGDTVNVAARLEAIARPMQILVTEQTMTAAGDGFSFARAGERVLTEGEAAVSLWELVG